MTNKRIETLKDVVDKPSLHEADHIILFNLIFQICMALAVFSIFIVCRKKLPWIYATNPKRCKQHPAAKYSGYFNWIVPIFTIPDTVLFELIGFDAFLFIETLKLLGIIFLFLSIVLMPGLGAYYYFFAKSRHPLQFITKVSLLSLPTNPRYANCLIPCISIWLITMIIIYFMYTFYRKYVILRQLHIRSRVFSRSTMSIKRYLNEISSLGAAISEINISSQTVFINNLPASIQHKADLIRYMKVLGVEAEPINAHVVTDTKTLENLINKKKKAILLLEEELQRFLIGLNIASLSTEFFVQNLRNYDRSLDLISNAITWHKKNVSKKEFMESEMHALMENALGGKFFDILEKVQRRKINLKIYKYVERIKILTEKIDVERRQSMKQSTEVSNEQPDSTTELHDTYNFYMNGSIFITVMSLFYIRDAYNNFIKSIPRNTHCGFVTFKNSSDASSLRMILIGSGAFSCHASEAPPADQVIWSVLVEPQIHRVIRKLVATILTIVFVSVFIVIVFFVSTLINISTLYAVVRMINPQLNAITGTPKFRKTFQGIIVPTVYAQFLSLAPIILKWICLFEGSISHIEFQKSFGRKYSMFLFFNGFLVIIFGSTIANLLNSANVRFNIVNLVSTPIVSSSIFFLNLLIHKTFGSLAFELLGMSALIQWVITYILGGVHTCREKTLQFDSKPINFGMLYPQVFLLFPMVLIYSIICPLFMALGCLYFFGAFFVFKYLFIYSHASTLESGGEHWPSLFENIFYSLTVFQLLTLIYFFSQKQYMSIVIILPLIIVTVGIWQGFTGLIKKNCYYLPKNESEYKQSQQLIQELFHARKKAILNWKESSAVEKDTYCLFKEKVLEDGETPYVYKDLSFLPSASLVILPKWFIITLMYLKENGDPAVFDLSPTWTQRLIG
ncbi:calcium permeable stress-gated cation channel [Nematocida ausubeli]|nr:calcium permeable stress-gated cation channel [Nematocida ausubeli]